MAQIGLKYLICAPVTETNNDVSYSDGLVMSYAIKTDLSIEINDVKLYGDDRIVEAIKEFKSGKLTLNGDHLEYEVLSLILGHKVETINPGNGKKMTAKGDDDGKPVGVGFYSTTVKDGKRRFRAIWLRKVKFGVPNESLETKGDSINFQTPSLEGTIQTDILGLWKEETTFEKESDAKAWLNEQADIDDGGNG
ncbi:MAG: phage tail protein [Oscillospiraceae bacterium]|nr:phage tail protein [Oscillospiraceae bacterium]